MTIHIPSPHFSLGGFIFFAVMLVIYLIICGLESGDKKTREDTKALLKDTKSLLHSVKIVVLVLAISMATLWILGAIFGTGPT